ncbi:MAG TPA: PHP domain-containing protein, partial [Rhabdaerophilum sp.]|nr:PHP domain-containing protein [Rhabdaerophilum sp.]
MASDSTSRDPILRAAAQLRDRPARPFVHLRVHSAYSLLEGALPLSKIVDHAVNDRAPAIAVTDTGNLFGALEFAQKAVKEGVQPIIACQMDVAFPGASEEGNKPSLRRQALDLFPLVLIAANETGYDNLVRLVSMAYLESNPGDPVHLTMERLAERADGLICLTGGPKGPLGRAIASDHLPVAETRLLLLKAAFGDRLYVELQRMSGYDRTIETRTIELAYRHELPLVATNEAFFRAKGDFDAHDALIAIAEGSVIAEDKRRRLTPDNYLKSQAEMAELFSDLPEALDSTIEIARRCSYYPKNRSPILPRFTSDAGAADGKD